MRITPTSVSRALFQNKAEYRELSVKEKDQMLFKVNQYMSRLFPHNAEALNRKGIIKDIALDVWFNAMAGRTAVPKGYFPDWESIKKEPKEKKKPAKKKETVKVTHKKKK